MESNTDLIIKLIFSLFGLFLFFYLITYVPECNAKTFKGDILITLEGNSMLPTIKNNSLCSCEIKEEYKKGDIVLFAINDGKYKLIVHRIISIKGTNVTTMGDNNKEADYPFTKESIICSIPRVPRIDLK